jgi:hypothetical protein
MSNIRKRERGIFALFLFISFAASLTGCASKPGTIKGAMPDARFVESPERRFAYSEQDKSWSIIGLDGRTHRQLFTGVYSIEDISNDGKTFVLSNSHTDLFIATERGRVIREVPEFHGRLGVAAITPDGKHVALTRHADFDLPQSQWVEDDSVYLLDTQTLESRQVAKYIHRNQGAFGIAWLDDEHVRISLFSGPYQKINTKTGEVEIFTEEDPLKTSNRWLAITRERKDCGVKIQKRGWGADEGLDIVLKDNTSKRLVIVEGRKRGFHDYQNTISVGTFTKDCRYLTFGFGGRLWVVEVDTGKVGPVTQDRRIFFERWYPIGLP